MQNGCPVFDFNTEWCFNIRSPGIDYRGGNIGRCSLNRQYWIEREFFHRKIGSRGFRRFNFQGTICRIIGISMLIGERFIGINLHRNIVRAFRQTGRQDGAVAASGIYSAQVQSRQFLAISQESDRNVDRSLVTEIFHNCCDRELLESADRVCRKLDITRRDFKIGSSGNRYCRRLLIIAFIRFRDLVIRINNCPDRITSVGIESMLEDQFCRLASDQLRDGDTVAESRGAIEELDFHSIRVSRAVVADLHFECHCSIHIRRGRCRRNADQFQFRRSGSVLDRNRSGQRIIGAIGVFRNYVCAIGGSSYGPLSGDKRQIFKTQNRPLPLE